LSVVPSYGDERTRLTRRDEFKKFKVEYDEVPEVIGAERVFHYFYLSGMAMISGGEISPLTWAELEAFVSANKLTLDIYIKKLLMNMSRIYVNGFGKFHNPKSDPPYRSPEDPLSKRKRKAK
ncbi:MAG: hypothetical protein V4607_02600, partial [Pseudomonadota bacterium]